MPLPFSGTRLAARALPAFAALFLLAGPAPAQTAAPFTPEQRGAIEGIIRDYLVKNPEVLQDAIAELEKRSAESQRKAQAAALAEVRDSVVSGSNAVVTGNTSGDVTLVEFFDYNCGYCKRALSDLRTLIKEDGKLRVVLRDLPVLGPGSTEAAKIAIAAKTQLTGERAFEYHARLLETRGQVGAERALAVAKEMGLDTVRIQRDAASPAVQAAVTANLALAEKLSLTGTPAYVVGGEVISGAVGSEPLREAIAAARKCGSAGC